jgi:hypothetical protein
MSTKPEEVQRVPADLAQLYGLFIAEVQIQARGRLWFWQRKNFDIWYRTTGYIVAWKSVGKAMDDVMAMPEWSRLQDSLSTAAKEAAWRLLIEGVSNNHIVPAICAAYREACSREP